MASCKYSLVVPAHNEEDNIGPLVDDIFGALGTDDIEIILVDDNSSDKTPELCDSLSAKNPRITSIHRKRGNNGMGYALIEGTGKARGDYVFWLMADRSDELSSVKKMIGMLDGGYDMVIASRYMRGGSRGDLDLHKAMYGLTYTTLTRLIFGIRLHDITNAFRGFRREILSDIKLRSGDFAISPEFAIKAHMKNRRLAEIPTTYHNRKAGRPKFQLLRMGVRYVGLFRLRFWGD
jgi:glycosyltransferase involved in cell wall biosynthesis